MEGWERPGNGTWVLSSFSCFIGSCYFLPRNASLTPKGWADWITYAMITVTNTHLRIAATERKDASPRDSWGAHTEPPTFVWLPLTSALTAYAMDSDSFKPLALFLSTCYRCLCPQILAFLQKLSSTSWSAAVYSGNTVTAPPVNALPWQCSVLL